MSDPNSTTADGGQEAPQSAPKRAPFPVERLLFALGFAVIAWVVLWVALFLGLVQWIVTAVSGSQDDTLKGWSRNLTQYLWEVLSFVLFAREDRPFPFGTPFPRM
jgi:Domain of unknown function (DUF4389)